MTFSGHFFMATLGFNRMKDLGVVELKRDFFWKEPLEAVLELRVPQGLVQSKSEG